MKNNRLFFRLMCDVDAKQVSGFCPTNRDDRHGHAATEQRRHDGAHIFCC